MIAPELSTIHSFRFWSFQAAYGSSLVSMIRSAFWSIFSQCLRASIGHRFGCDGNGRAMTSWIPPIFWGDRFCRSDRTSITISAAHWSTPSAPPEIKVTTPRLAARPPIVLQSRLTPHIVDLFTLTDKGNFSIVSSLKAPSYHLMSISKSKLRLQLTIITWKGRLQNWAFSQPRK